MQIQHNFARNRTVTPTSKNQLFGLNSFIITEYPGYEQLASNDTELSHSQDVCGFFCFSSVLGMKTVSTLDARNTSANTIKMRFTSNGNPMLRPCDRDQAKTLPPTVGPSVLKSNKCH